MSYRATQSNFSKGEIAPHLYGRFDVDAWQSAVKQARNVIVLKYGGLSKRPGTRLVSEVLYPQFDTRLIPFQFSQEQSYALEFGQAYASPCAGGGRVLEEELAITNISAAANAQITAAFHGYLFGDVVFLDGIDGEMGDLLNGRFWFVVTVIDDNNFTINAVTTGMTFTGASGGITRVANPTPPPTPTVPPPYVPPDPPVVEPGYGNGGWGDGFPAIP